MKGFGLKAGRNSLFMKEWRKKRRLLLVVVLISRTYNGFSPGMGRNGNYPGWAGSGIKERDSYNAIMRALGSIIYREMRARA